MFLPMFPEGSKMISSEVAVSLEPNNSKDGSKWYQYWINGAPLYRHEEDDLSSFRFIMSNLIVQKLLNVQEVCKCFDLKEDSVRKQVKRLREGGQAVFFNHKRSEQKCHKIRGALLVRLQPSFGLMTGRGCLTW